MKPGCGLTFSAPGKTFLLGEYAVLSSGQALLLATGPVFSLQLVYGKEEDPFGFLSEIGQHTMSPAGRLWQALLQMHPVSLATSARINGKGFGGSSAYLWFALLYEAFIKRGSLPILDAMFFSETLARIRTLETVEGRVQPSCADFAAQYAGRCAMTDLHRSSVVSKSWPFADVAFILVRTGLAFSTPKHLSGLRFSADPLIELTKKAIAAFEAADQQTFLDSFCRFQNRLVSESLQLANTTALIAKFQQGCPGFIAAKGCGAMGAETICVLVSEACRERALRYFLSNNIAVVADTTTLQPGLTIKSIPEALVGQKVPVVDQKVDRCY